MNRDHFWLMDRQFARIAPHVPTDTRGKPRVDARRVMRPRRTARVARCSLRRCQKMNLGGC